MPKLFVAYLGGKTNKSRIGEDHEVVLVVANDKEEAKKKARIKWGGEGAAHLDMLVEINIVDGYKVNVEKASTADSLIADDDWTALNPTLQNN